MTRSRNLIAPKHRWSDDDDETLRLNFPMWPAFLIAHLVGCRVSAVYKRAAALGVSKSPYFWRNPMAHLWSGWDSEAGKASQFPAGHVPANKGLRRPGFSPGNMAQTQFRKGAKPQTWLPIGTDQIRDGYLWRKVRDDGPPILSRNNWEPVHVLLWVEHHGPVPANHVVVFRDRNKENIAIENLELVDRAELMRRNTIHNLPPELVDVIRLTAGLKRRIRRREKQVE